MCHSLVQSDVGMVGVGVVELGIVQGQGAPQRTIGAGEGLDCPVLLLCTGI